MIDSQFEGRRGQITPASRANLRVGSGNTPGTIMMVTSAQHGEGVSTITRRLAMGYSHRPGDTLLVDCNLRNNPEPPTDQQPFYPGLCEIIRDQESVTSCINTDSGDSVHRIRSGGGSKHPAALFVSENFINFLYDLRYRYARVLIDAPPVIPYPDASLIGSSVDCILMVIRAEKTYDRVIDQALRKLERSGGSILGAVLNRRRYHIPEWLYHRL
jgi:capsular exopolysaccharide synthesis family protein